MDPMAQNILPPDPDYPLLHTRNYEVRSFLKDENTVIIRGAVMDRKPGGLYVPDDVEPLVMHHMIVDLTVVYPQMEIVDAAVVFEAHPHTTCTAIVDHYQKLIGLNIARGFTHKIRELFGGPRACTHTTALIQAMAPVAMQTIWSMQAVKAKQSGATISEMVTPEERKRSLAMNLNTCHVWAEDGPNMTLINAGEELPPPLQIIRRFKELGKDPTGWSESMRPKNG